MGKERFHVRFTFEQEVKPHSYSQWRGWSEGDLEAAVETAMYNETGDVSQKATDIIVRRKDAGRTDRTYLDKHPHREELIEKGKGGSFYTVSPLDMTKDDLYMMIGYLGEERARGERNTEEFHRMIDAIDLAR